MIKVLDGRDFEKGWDFVQALNAARRENPQQWIVYAGQVAGRKVEIKTFGHGDLQIARVDGQDRRRLEYGMNVGQWKAEILRIVS